MTKPFLRLFGLAAAMLALGGCALHTGRALEIVDAPGVSHPIVQTASGPVRGAASANGRAFLGLPFAAPPVGPLRWRPPEPATPWTAVRDATRPGPWCVQKLGPLVLGKEDCLYLNVYTPPGPPPADAWPVMAFLPGGAFVIGAADNYDPSRLASWQGVVVVTVNYRLGAFGFFAHPALRAESSGGGSGNYGLLDQQAALRWIGANIAAFGGDPKAVTLFGESAGAWSVCDQMVSPGADGLFARAIMESGSCTDRHSLVPAAEADADGPAFAAELGCTDPAAVLACLRAVPTGRLAKAKSTRRGIEGPGSWGPVWGDPVIPLSPRDAFASGRYPKRPAISGANLDEGRVFAISIHNEKDYRRQVAKDFKGEAARVLAQYPAAAYPSPRLAYAAIVTDARFACPALTLRAAIGGQSPLYAYEFADEHAPISLPQWITGGPMGAYHTSELASVFDTRWALADPATFTPAQAALSRRIMAAWGRFARGAPPSPDWPRFAPGGYIRTLAPDGDAAAPDFARRHACAFWADTPGWG